LNAGALGGLEVALTNRRPQLTFDMSLGSSYQHTVRQNAAYRDARVYHLDRQAPLTVQRVNVDARLALGLCW
jgi:hypothetical protein